MAGIHVLLVYFQLSVTALTRQTNTWALMPMAVYNREGAKDFPNSTFFHAIKRNNRVRAIDAAHREQFFLQPQFQKISLREKPASKMGHCKA